MKTSLLTKMEEAFDVTFKSFIEEVSGSIGMLMLADFGVKNLFGHENPLSFRILKGRLLEVLLDSSEDHVRVFASNHFIFEDAIEKVLEEAKVKFSQSWGIEVEAYATAEVIIIEAK